MSKKQTENLSSVLIKIFRIKCHTKGLGKSYIIINCILSMHALRRQGVSPIYIVGYSMAIESFRSLFLVLPLIKHLDIIDIHIYMMAEICLNFM